MVQFNNLGDDLWSDLPATEKKNYVHFHENAYVEDRRHSEKNMLDFPRWSIISGYYCMHNITKLFLARELNIKISSPDIHMKTIAALEHYIKDDKMRTRLIALLREAKVIYFNVARLKENILPLMLKRAKQERGKAQYYTDDFTRDTQVNSQKASYFLETIVKPYLELMERLMHAP